MHSNVRLYTSSTLECSLCLCGSQGWPTPSWMRYLAIWLHEMKAHLYMPVLADNMHSNVRLYTSSTLECSHCLSGSLGLTTPLPGWRYSAILDPWNEGSLVHAVLADNMHSNVRLYTSSTLECSHYLCASLVWPHPFLDEDIRPSWLHEMKAHLSWIQDGRISSSRKGCGQTQWSTKTVWALQSTASV